MRGRFVRSVIAVGLVAAGAGASAAAASADPGPGTFTRITSPGTRIYKYNSAHPAANTFAVSGVTSSDVSSVDIDCISYTQSTDPSVRSFATDVPVKSGKFSIQAAFPTITTNCRLRAFPSDLADLTYLASFSGPVLYVNALQPMTSNGVTYGYIAVGEQGDGVAAAADASTCGVALVATVELPSMTLVGQVSNGGEVCAFALPPSNVTANGTPTASSIQVDGHNAYLPAGVVSYLDGSLSLGLTPAALTTTLARASNGDVTVTESAPLQRCSVDDTYPATTASCPKLVSAGVTFKRTLDLFRGAHQIRVRDTFTSTGVAHKLSLQYGAGTAAAPTGSPGFVFPGHGSTVVGAKAGQVVTGLGTKAATMLVRSDRYAGADDSQADTRGLTWSKAPSKIQFAKQPTSFGMAYALTIPAHGVGFLGFAASEALTTAGVAPLAAQAVTDLITAPAISSPANHASIKGKSTTVKGSIAAGANGLPTSVSVDGHKATIHTTSPTAATWAVTFNESYAAHTITATAADAAGNTAARSITVRNKA